MLAIKVLCGPVLALCCSALLACGMSDTGAAWPDASADAGSSDSGPDDAGNILVAGFGFGRPGLHLPGGAPLAGPVTANTDYELLYTVYASSTRAETFAVSAVITPSSGGWTASIVPGDESLAVPQTVTGVTRTARVRVRTGASGSASIRLLVRGTTDARSGAESDETPVFIGATGPDAVTEVIFGPLTKAALMAPIGVSGGTVYFGNESGAATDRVVRFAVTVFAPASAMGATRYQIGSPVISGGGGWEARLDNAPSDLSLNVPTGGVMQGVVRLALRFTGAFDPAMPTAFDRTVAIPITGPVGTQSRTMTINLHRRADHTNPLPL
jgi:hypothetical protein